MLLQYLVRKALACLLVAVGWLLVLMLWVQNGGLFPVSYTHLKQGVPAQGVQLRLVKGGSSHTRQNVLCGFLTGLCSLIRCV